MTVFRWIIGVPFALFGIGWAFTFLLYVLRDDDRLRELGTRLRHWTLTIGLAWFNIEIWGRVVYTMVTWNR
jgi:hypothetical protein